MTQSYQTLQAKQIWPIMMVVCFTVLQVLLLIISSDHPWKMPNPSELNVPNETLSVIFIENPTASYDAQHHGHNELSFLPINNIACPKIKQAFPHLVFAVTGEDSDWVIYEWVSSMTLSILLN
jgi:hypothetical protein